MILTWKQLVGCVAAGAVLGFGLILTHAVPGLTHADTTNTPRHRNSVRTSDLARLGNALAQYKSDAGKLPVSLPATDTPVCTSAGQDCLSKHYVDLSFLITGGDYIEAIPVDPGNAVGLWASGYTIAQLPNGRIRLTAPQAEQDAVITIYR